jgi:HicB-like protein involved in pilus formation/nucleotidyltransferase-like protein
MWRMATRKPAGRRDPIRPDAAVRFLLRLPATIHRQLTARAAANGLSLNEYCVRKLAGPEPAGVGNPAVVAIRAHAEAVAAARLTGIIVHGSWARGESRASSDVDVLLVVRRDVALTRGLYRAWDAATIHWDERPVDAHFVHLPADPDRAGGLWCEAAVDGLLLHDSDGSVDHALRAVRRAIADRRLVRRQAHGQPYWTTAA